MTSSYAIAVAIGAALAFAVTEVSLRNSLRFASLVTVSILTLLIQCLILSALIVMTGRFSEMTAAGAGWFLLAGLGNPVFHMVFYFLGIQRIGIVRAAPLKGSGPIFSVIFAFRFLGERLILLQYLGIAMVVGGILIISTEGWSRKVPQTSPPPSGPPSDKDRPNPAPPRRAVYLLPVLAGLMGGIASILFKTAMKKMPSPLLGIWLGSAEGLLLFPLIALLFPAGQRYRFNPSAIPWLISAGVCGSAAMFGLVFSIGLGQVSVVFTLAQSSPIFVILISVLFLRKLERVTPRVVLGGLMTVGGGILVSVL